jgi:NAD dependent epimerase/dehydratase
MSSTKKVLVTGADGFIGSHLTEQLVSEGYDVRAFVYYNSFNSWGWLDTLSASTMEKVEIFAGDIRDTHAVLTAAEGTDIIFHLAALIAIPYSYYAPESYVDTNVKGTLNILQAAKIHKTRRVLVTSTSEVYGTALYVPIDEKHPRQGQSPYSASKIGADAMADSFYRSFNLPVTIVRPFNTFGPRQSARAVIPTIITQMLNGASSVKLGSLHPTRDLLYVKDTAKGFTAIARSEKTIGEEINLATGQEISVGELAGLVAELTKSNATITSENQRIRPEKSEVERLLGCNKKALKLTGWQPVYDIRTALSETISWFADKNNLVKYKSDIYNV